MQPAKRQAQIGPGLLQRLEDMGGLVRRDVKLPPQFAHIGDAVRPGEAQAHLDLAHRAEGVRGIAEILRRNAGHQLARPGAHDAEHRFRRRHVGDDGKILTQMRPHPGEVALQGRPRHDGQIGRLGQPRDRQIGFDPAPVIQEHRVHDAPGGHVHLGRAEPVEEGTGITPLDPDFPERRHVEQSDPRPHGHVLGLLVLEPVLAAPGIAILPLLPRPRKPVRAFPARHLAKDGAPRLEVFMQRRAPHAPRGLDLPIGEVIGVKQPERLGHPFLQVFPVALERLRPADIDLPQIEGRLALGDPVRQRHPRPARPRDADRVVARGDPVAAQFRGLAQIIAVVGGKAFRPIEEGVDASRLEQRHAVHRRLEDRLEMVEILGQRVEAEILADAVHPPGFRLGLEGPQHHLARILLVVGAFVGHPQDGQMAQPLDGFGDQIEMLASMQGQRDARGLGQIAAPHTAAVDDHIGGDMARRAVGHIVHAGDPAPGPGDARHLHAFENLRTAHPRALGQRHRDIGGVALPVQRQGHRAHHVGDVQMRVFRLDLGRRNLVHLDIEDARDGGLTQQFLVPRRRERDRDAADLPHAGGDAGLGFQLDVEVGRILGQPGHVRGTPQLPDQPRRMPCGAAGQLPAFQQHDIGPARLGEVIGDRTAGDTAADDDRAGLGGKGHGSLASGISTSLPG